MIISKNMRFFRGEFFNKDDASKVTCHWLSILCLFQGLQLASKLELEVRSILYLHGFSEANKLTIIW